MTTKQLKEKYIKIFDKIKNEKFYENFKDFLEFENIEFEYIPALKKYYIKEKINSDIYIISFGKINLLNDEVRFYLLITCDYITILDEEKEVKRKKTTKNNYKYQ